MGKIETAFFDLGALDELAARDSAVHRLDPRAKLLTTAAFVLTVVSFGRYEISALLPFFLFPAALLAAAGLPAGPLARRLLLAAPFALLVGAFNPLLDREVLLRLGGVGISGGWLSFLSIQLRFLLTVGAALVLIATTGFAPLCLALERLGAPRIFALQLLFLYRYLFVLVEEGGRLARARTLRAGRGRGTGVRVFGTLAGQLLLRSLDRARRLHLAMLSRGFDGEIRLLRPLRLGGREFAFIGGWATFFLLLRVGDLPRRLGELLLEIGR
jgi:cobalt/nickel transport system permease protein